jgi:hypothetical protein
MNVGARSDERDELVTVDPPPACLCGVEQLVGHRHPRVGQQGPLVVR